jgi:hypothetical protein
MLLRSLDVGCLLAFGALRDLKLDFLTFFQGLEAAHLNLREVSEEVFAAIVRRNETIAFRIVKPLDCTGCHIKRLSKKGQSHEPLRQEHGASSKSQPFAKLAPSISTSSALINNLYSSCEKKKSQAISAEAKYDLFG